MFKMILYLEFAVRAEIQFSLENPNSIKVAKAPEYPTAGIEFPLEKRQHKLQLELYNHTDCLISRA